MRSIMDKTPLLPLGKLDGVPPRGLLAIEGKTRVAVLAFLSGIRHSVYCLDLTPGRPLNLLARS